MEVIIKKYEHYNRAMGKYISNKSQYQDEMKRGGYVSWEEGQKNVEKYNSNSRKKYEMSRGAKDLINEVKMKADKKGNVKLSGREIDFMKSRGMKFVHPSTLKDHIGGRK